MKRLLTVTGVAAMFAVGLAAQQTTTGTSGTTAQGTQTATTAGGQRGGPRTITGCLRAGDTAGTYTLTNIEGMGGGRSGGGAGSTTAGATTTGGGTTTGSTAAGATTTGQAGGRGMNSLMLTADSSVDLKAHVGHKIEVTGTMAGGRRGDTTSGGTTAGGATTGGGTTAGGGTSTAGTAGTRGGGMRSMTVTSVKMVSDSCS